jgi:hypothetical protein
MILSNEDLLGTATDDMLNNSSSGDDLKKTIVSKQAVNYSLNPITVENQDISD